MEIIKTIPKMRQWAERARASHKTIGLVPTMGSLHAGHMSLVHKSVSTCDVTVASIFINPAQFGENEDLDTYPKNLDGDRRLLESAGVDVLFSPSSQEMYPKGYKTFVTVEDITDHLCGKSRPGFFRGIATVIVKLFNIVRPHTGFFGDKDWQQATVVETLLRDLNIEAAIERLPILREADGLAKSSRNVYLSKDEMAPARSLSEALRQARQRVQNGQFSADKIRQEIRQTIETNKAAKIDYISICDPESFVEQDKINNKCLIALAVQIGKTRLIDNCIVRREKCRE
ncbi:Pantoate--beta-alanine ligase [hydrothermal vent metagenome]|uniref:pantoate--beta-alanine ligase (AMP-forming) n=1 Tax=hydrothermal vent metagenome TaxID=652676 RepID=A0A3B1D3V9_9ZZZZ